jgi:NAD(P)H-dependent FMN reductase
MTKPHVAIVVGSNRRDSINRKLGQALANLGAEKFDANIVRIDDLPMFNQDNEGNEGTRKFIQGFLDQFASLVERLRESARSAA